MSGGFARAAFLQGADQADFSLETVSELKLAAPPVQESEISDVLCGLLAGIGMYSSPSLPKISTESRSTSIRS
jgi:hypothetical protein